MIIAIPKLGETIAPCFEAAEYFIISTIKNGKEVKSEIVTAAGCEGFGRVRLLRGNKVNTLICNGIKNFYKDLLKASGISVYSNVTISANEALVQFQKGLLKQSNLHSDIVDFSYEIPHEDLICWAKEFFESHGFSVAIVSGQAPFPIDLIASIECPVCHKPIKTAICCGGHTYRTDQEIKEFHHSATSKYQVQVYIYPAARAIRQYCREYGIELIDPDFESINIDRQGKGLIPILQGPIPGHEKAFNQEGT